MPRKTKRHTVEQIIGILREAETCGKPIQEFVREKGVSEQTFYRWRSKYGGGQVSKQLRKRPNGTGANRLSGVLRMAALSLSRSKTALGAYYRRIARRKEGKVAIFATAR